MTMAKKIEMETTVLIEAPVGALVEGDYRPRHVSIILFGEQQSAMKRLFRGMDETGSRLKNGRRVSSNADAIRYLLEQVGEK